MSKITIINSDINDGIIEKINSAGGIYNTDPIVLLGEPDTINVDSVSIYYYLDKISYDDTAFGGTGVKYLQYKLIGFSPNTGNYTDNINNLMKLQEDVFYFLYNDLSLTYGNLDGLSDEIQYGVGVTKTPTYGFIIDFVISIEYSEETINQ